TLPPSSEESPLSPCMRVPCRREDCPEAPAANAWSSARRDSHSLQAQEPGFPWEKERLPPQPGQQRRAAAPLPAAAPAISPEPAEQAVVAPEEYPPVVRH